MGNQKWSFFVIRLAWRESDTSRCPYINKTSICFSPYLKLSYSGKFIPCRFSKCITGRLYFHSQTNFKLWRSLISCRRQSMTEGWYPRGKRYMQTISLHLILKFYYTDICRRPCDVFNKSRNYLLQSMVSLRPKIACRRNVVNNNTVYISFTETKKLVWNYKFIFISLKVRKRIRRVTKN